MTGFKTRNILCVPVKDVSNDNRVVAVIEAINKNPGDYDAQVIAVIAVIGPTCCLVPLASTIGRRSVLEYHW